MHEKTLNAYFCIAKMIAMYARKISTDYYHNEYRQHYPHLKEEEIIYSNNYMSTFEQIADTLERLKLMRPLDRQCSVFICKSEQELETIKENYLNGPPFDELLQNFVDLFAEHGTAYSDFNIEPNLHVEPKLRESKDVINALASLDYAERVHDGFRWTEKITPMLIASGMCDKNGKPIDWKAKPLKILGDIPKK
jgi:hypothetical protein